jgi:hypothetical protein
VAFWFLTNLEVALRAVPAVIAFFFVNAFFALWAGVSFFWRASKDYT